MSAIFKREFKAYFNSPVGYVVLAAFLFFSGIFFYVQSLYAGTSDMSGVFGNMFFILLFLIPLLTMRLLSEEKRNKTEQALLTSPISLFSIVGGKFLSALAVYGVCISVFVLQGVILSFASTPDWSVIIGNLLALLLLGSALISVGLFLSSLTESVVVAAVTAFVVNILLLLLDSFQALIPWDFAKNILDFIDFNSKYTQMTLGVFSLFDTVFFLSITALFLFFTVKVLEKRRFS